MSLKVKIKYRYKDRPFDQRQNRSGEGGLCRTHIEIPYYFKGKLATAGNEFEGDFLLITNAGEYNIPYRVVVTPVMAETSIGRICQMEDFVKLYHENRQEAMELFFLPNFSSIFLKHLPEQDAMYHSLMKSRSRNMIVEEFLSAAGWKEPAALAIEEKQVVLDAGKDRGEITLILTADGYVEGTISSEKGQVQSSAGRFTSADFKDGRMKLSIEKNHNYTVGKRPDPDPHGASGNIRPGGMVGNPAAGFQRTGDQKPR